MFPWVLFRYLLELLRTSVPGKHSGNICIPFESAYRPPFKLPAAA
jgi:hypothetical protein